MSLKALIVVGASVTALSFAPPAHAQESDVEQPSGNTNTTQTDQSEEDWRRSRRKDDIDDFDPISNPMNTGVGNILITTEPIDQLPPESRRHLKRQRARAIAGMGPNGEMQEVAYEPSPGAQADPNLAAQEQAVWEDMMEGLGAGGRQSNNTDKSGTGGQGQAGQASRQGTGNASQGQSDQGTGQQTGQQDAQSGAPQAMRGGSAASASDILNQMRGQVPGAGQGTGSIGTGNTDQQGAQNGQAGSQGQTGTQTGQSGGAVSGQSGDASTDTGSGNQSDQQVGAQGSQPGQGQSSSTGQQSDSTASPSTNQNGSSSVLRGGSAASASDILNQMRGGQISGGAETFEPDSSTTSDVQSRRPAPSTTTQPAGAATSSASDYLKTEDGR